MKTFASTGKLLQTLRTPESISESSIIAGAVADAIVMAQIREASRLARIRDLKANPHRRWVAPVWEEDVYPAPAAIVPRPCEITSFTFSKGETISKCRGVFQMPDGALRRCTWAAGQFNKASNSNRHQPQALATVAAVHVSEAEIQSASPAPIPERDVADEIEQDIEQDSDETPIEELTTDAPAPVAGTDDVEIAIDVETGKEFEVDDEPEPVAVEDDEEEAAHVG